MFQIKKIILLVLLIFIVIIPEISAQFKTEKDDFTDFSTVSSTYSFDYIDDVGYWHLVEVLLTDGGRIGEKQPIGLFDISFYTQTDAKFNHFTAEIKINNDPNSIIYLYKPSTIKIDNISIWYGLRFWKSMRDYKQNIINARNISIRVTYYDEPAKTYTSYIIDLPPDVVTEWRRVATTFQ